MSADPESAASVTDGHPDVDPTAAATAAKAASVVVFDVNQTLSDTSELGERFVDVGLAAELADTWFSALLRDGFALTMAGVAPAFDSVAEQSLWALLSDQPVHRGPEAGIAHVLAAFDYFPLHSDVSAGVEALAASGRRLVALSNSPSDATEKLFARTGLSGSISTVPGVAEAGGWKPAAAAYEYAARSVGVTVGDMLLVSVHPWDIDGASRAGMRTAWVDRFGTHYPSVFTAPDLHVSGIDDLAAQLTR